MSTNLADTMLSLLPEHISRISWDAPRIAQQQRDSLRALLAQLQQQSPFYARQLVGIDAARFELSDLAALPVLTKDTMMDSFDELCCDRRLTTVAVEAHLAATGSEPSLLFDEYMVLASGGSSGRRGFFVFDRKAAAEYLLSGVRASTARMLANPSPSAGGRLRIAIVAATSAVHATRALPVFFSGGMMEVHSIPATVPLEQIARQLEELQTDALQGYPTIIAMLADERAAGRLDFSPRAITTSSEPLDRGLRERIERGFGVPVSDQFGSSEGLMGSSEPGDERIVLPADLTIVELVDENDRPVPPGTESAKVLLTTLYNRVQPLLRYELTDRFTLCRGDFADGHPRVTVSGRSDDLLRYGAVPVHPHALRSVLVNSASVREYQIRQTGTGAEVDVVAAANATPDLAAIESRLAEALAKAGLARACVRVRCVDALSRDEKSGKVRRIVPLRRELRATAA